MKKITVSLWFGKFPKEDLLDNYLEIKFSRRENNSISSTFWTDYKIKGANYDLQESGWEENVESVEDLLSGCSYEKNFIDKVKDQITDPEASKYNSMILIIDYKYDGKIKKTSKTAFI